ncbi:MAG TPA: GTP cyclohydrolase MptA [Candidatus Thermoplasmatota archaeon]|nr:GTP cyclohydrolase MptA [Candidatus Thermoplasmatota archaeon]
MPPSHLPDVQNFRAPHNFTLTRVGVTGVAKPITVARPGRAARTLLGTFDVAVDLPAEQRGTHMSRNVEAINATIDAFARETTAGLEELASRLAATLLERHAYATRAEVRVEADYFRERRTPLGAPSLEVYHLVAGADAERGGAARRSIGVEVLGMTACPCAMEGTRHLLEERGVRVPEMPTVTHNQRNRVSLVLDFTTGAVEADDLVDICEQSLSAPTFEYLKRGDEATLVLQAHAHPRFVEDVVREVLARVVKAYGQLPADTLVVARSEAEESIHKHNAYAERVTTLEELRS